MTIEHWWVRLPGTQASGDPVTTRRVMFDLGPALDRRPLAELFDWWRQHMDDWSVLVATEVVADHIGHDEQRYLLFERLVIHLVAEAVTAPMWWALWEDEGDLNAREAYGAALGKQWLCYELLTEYVGEKIVSDAEDWLAAMADAMAWDELPTPVERVRPNPIA